ncbi:uncharacterized protein TNCV_3875611 [Trichonephila clavipes]|uniref:Uncharacterized protein n=1 Tax=Trichonephila clavipes TaxID=2585209 RepID=A0A8X6T563_TRICX|nr:uncharacterized protein TNCV_3875611 [Trichonephila clavipes]
MARRNHLDDFTSGKIIEKLEEGCTVTSVAAEFGINKSVVSRAWKAFQTTGTAFRKIVGATRGRQLQGMIDVSSCRRKEVESSQQEPLLSNSVQQHCDKGRGSLWPDTFKKEAYSPTVLNAASL